MQSSKNAYRGPQADAATFTTQQKFLDSLAPIPVESVDADSRRCSYCWKQYGESNPGCDDAEAPVKFQCEHVFGEKCMRALFAIKEPARVDLIPLSFSPGSKGADLGSRLSAYIDSQGVEKSELTSSDRKKHFAHLLQEVMPTVKSIPDSPPGPLHGRGLELLGKDWLGLVYEMFTQSGFPPGPFHLLENAIVIDDEPWIKQPLYPAASLSAYGASQIPMPSALPPGYTPWLGSNWPTPMPSAAALAYYAPNTLATSYGSTWDQEPYKLKVQQEKQSPAVPNWQDIVSTKSGLDSLVEKNKELLKEQKQLAEQAAKGGAEQKYAASEENRVKTFMKELAGSFAKVYEAYEQYQYDEAVAAGLPPPVKLGLADPNINPSVPHASVQGSNGHFARSPVFLLTGKGVVHERFAGAKGVEVIQPYSDEPIATEDMDDDDSDSDSDAAYIVDAERAPAAFAGKTILLKRKPCQLEDCCTWSNSLSEPLRTPEYVFWPDNKKAPDNCPLCRRVLFKKNG
ncbi:hypothetical protein SLS60_000182 [Paraconiothyrium brasiliense]|uniref:RING-type domain-containing protein n=1 Tax=Paraconiothyrium brasiliense TaxID=300254 RepID=A0ABR3S5I7_9PLEO